MSVRAAAFWWAWIAGLAGVVATLGVVALNVDARPDGWTAWLLPAGLGIVATTGLAAVAANRVAQRLNRRLAQLGDAADVLARQPSAVGPRVIEGDPEVERLHRAIDGMSRSMHALLERERSFARYASHELRTPVGALKVQLERVELGTASAADVLPAVARQTQRIEELIDALLALTRARDQGSRIRLLRPLLSDTLESLAEAERSRVYFVEPVPEVEVRESVLVHQALRNLIDNAVRHGTGPVTVRAETDEELLTVRVRDMGSGIQVSELRRLAQPVEERAPRSDGHGLGLTLVALIARALEGRLHLHNTDVGLEASVSFRVASSRRVGTDRVA